MIENRVRLSLPRHLKCWDYGAHNKNNERILPFLFGTNQNQKNGGFF